jgi:hypothetical protein
MLRSQLRKCRLAPWTVYNDSQLVAVGVGVDVGQTEHHVPADTTNWELQASSCGLAYALLLTSTASRAALATRFLACNASSVRWRCGRKGNSEIFKFDVVQLDCQDYEQRKVENLKQHKAGLPLPAMLFV